MRDRKWFRNEKKIKRLEEELNVLTEIADEIRRSEVIFNRLGSEIYDEVYEEFLSASTEQLLKVERKQLKNRERLLKLRTKNENLRYATHTLFN